MSTSTRVRAMLP